MLELAKRIVAVAAFVCLAGGFGFAEWQASNKTTAQQQTDRPSEAKEYPQTVGTPATTFADQSHADKNRSDSKNNKNRFADFFEIKLADLLIAIFTGVLAWKTAGLFRETEGLRAAADNQRIDFLRSIEASERATLAAENSAAALVDNERPWVGVVTVTVHQIGPGMMLRGVVTIMNTGQTPARDMRAAFLGSITNATAQRGDAPDVTRAPAKALFPNIPADYYPFHGQSQLSQGDFEGIREGGKILWVIGRIEYLDNRGRLQWTNSCSRWDQSRAELHLPRAPPAPRLALGTLARLGARQHVIGQRQNFGGPAVRRPQDANGFMSVREYVRI